VNGVGSETTRNGFCDACFSNVYPISVQPPSRLRQLRLITA
jgi:hypothetical protein